MLKIRLERVGRVHEPSFRLVLTDSKNSSKSGRFKEILGSYDPRKSRDVLEAERIKYWISQGASPTPTVHNLLVKHKVVDAKKIHVSTKSKHIPAVTTEKAPEVDKEAKTDDAIIEPVSEEKAEEEKAV
jgi:small subunit ribosomal protein S16